MGPKGKNILGALGMALQAAGSKDPGAVGGSLVQEMLNRRQRERESEKTRKHEKKLQKRDHRASSDRLDTEIDAEKDLQESAQGHATSEREAGQEFTTDEREASQTFTAEQATKSRKLQKRLQRDRFRHEGEMLRKRITAQEDLAVLQNEMEGDRWEEEVRREMFDKYANMLGRSSPKMAALIPGAAEKASRQAWDDMDEQELALFSKAYADAELDFTTKIAEARATIANMALGASPEIIDRFMPDRVDPMSDGSPDQSPPNEEGTDPRLAELANMTAEIQAGGKNNGTIRKWVGLSREAGASDEAIRATMIDSFGIDPAAIDKWNLMAPPATLPDYTSGQF